MNLLFEFLLSVLRTTLPLLFAAYGGLLSERSGVANIALESFLLIGGFFASLALALTHSAAFSLVGALGASLLLSCIFSFFVLAIRADQLLVGLGLNLLIAGLIPVLSGAWVGNTGGVSIQNNEGFGFLFFVVLAVLVVLATLFLFRFTRFGLRLRAAGENPDALRSQGISVSKIRFVALLLGGMLAALGGACLSLHAGIGYIRGNSAGRGYIALAALILGRWHPLYTAIACLFFGVLDALPAYLGSWVHLPQQLISLLPYISTIVLLAGFMNKSRAPRAINDLKE